MKKILLIAILALALFLRTYRVADFLGFWFDQGRDAKVVWDIWHSGKLTLIGPTTGIEGIFLGPFYYYLITPAYILGGGNPVYPAVFLALLNVLAIYYIYKLGEEFLGPNVGLVAAFITAVSQQFVGYQRWLSNPTPLPLFAVLTLDSLLKRRWWLVGLCAGLSLQLEAASAIFFLPAILIIAFLHKLKIPLVALLLFGLTLMPQIVFNFRHQNILFNSFKRFLVSERSFQPNLGAYTKRLNFYYTIFTNKYFTTDRAWAIFAVSLPALFLLVRRKLPPLPTTILIVWWVTPLILLLFYHGNHDYIWDYYFTGVYPAFTLLIAAIWLSAGRWAAAIFLAVFIFQNVSYHLAYFRQTLPGYITLTPQIQAVDWIYQDAAGQSFNTDVYVPPVIPHAYDYLFLWRGKSARPSAQLVSRLYTIYEPDGEHPQFLSAWQTRQDGIGKIDTTLTFGPLTVSRRTRLLYDQ
ncbi:MAG: hypothetical protein UX80_C0005G0048 [Candidatus Amesbacteria bacterium GW2011_GWA2_47_11b]|uniref:Glycosyltransferase RgtA/B/C/D-like domain-containing protein n=3 Tax=Candidatus Amesiibacteriota TaxID=1752730 RepID=A0A0G1SLJ4_9BACT|nr:MAG: hypothetical protein UX42_C0001G0105 [Microgenomates group bacterium GW2011_GWC1_46_20]KKU58228.1 MAG: hypothetical protein UX80_C0005G0048 [Candidatus Amesbacteria bacterium GW2011_GWA2_47_11b]KKU70296.1 MAG: hypothetical protein UX92_C0002G0040 [Candidatus Amesbacteria bacterium GW2011_GWA1_47_20]